MIVTADIEAPLEALPMPNERYHRSAKDITARSPGGFDAMHTAEREWLGGLAAGVAGRLLAMLILGGLVMGAIVLTQCLPDSKDRPAVTVTAP